MPTTPNPKPSPKSRALNARWVLPENLKPGMIVRHVSGCYRAGETTLIVDGQPWGEGLAWTRVPVIEWSVWTLKVRSGSALQVVGQL